MNRGFAKLTKKGVKDYNVFGSAAVIKQAKDGYQHARRNPTTATSLIERAKAVMPNA